MKLPWMYLLLGPLFVLLWYGKSQPARQSEFDPAAVDEFITRQMAAQRVPGLALAITQGERVLYAQGYGSAGNGRPVTPRTQFFIASVSKSFTALAVMQLVEDGLIDLDAPVQTYLPEFSLTDPALAAAQGSATITVRHLLNQTSGLSDTGFAELLRPQPRTIAERVTSLRDARPVAPPGTEYHYFNPNYGVLARLVEVVSGQPFAEYLDARVFTPLAMNNTLAVVTSTEGKQQANDLAHGHLIVFGVPFAYPEADGYLGGSGGVITTAEDIAHFLIAQNNGGRYLDQQLVTPESIAWMHTPPAEIDSDYAMGWTERIAPDGTRIIEHNGIISTYSADAALLPEESLGIALLYDINSFPTTAFGSPPIKNGLIALLTGKQPPTGGFSVAWWGWIFAGLTLVGGLLAVRSLLRLPRWAEKARAAPLWRLLPGIAWTFVPLLALLGLPALTARFADRVFGFTTLYKSMLDILAWLGLTGVLGAINGTARIAILARRFTRPGR